MGLQLSDLRSHLNDLLILLQHRHLCFAILFLMLLSFTSVLLLDLCLVALELCTQLFLDGLLAGFVVLDLHGLLPCEPQLLVEDRRRSQICMLLQLLASCSPLPRSTSWVETLANHTKQAAILPVSLRHLQLLASTKRRPRPLFLHALFQPLRIFLILLQLLPQVLQLRLELGHQLIQLANLCFQPGSLRDIRFHLLLFILHLLLHHVRLLLFLHELIISQLVLNAALLSHLLDFHFEIGDELLLVLKLLLECLPLIF